MKKILPNSNSPLEDYRIFSEVNCIVSDIDGTLTCGSTPILEQIKKKTFSLRRNKVITTIATGRPYRGAYHIVNDLGIADGTPIVLYNGGVLLKHHTGHIIKEYAIPYVEMKRIVEIVAKYGAGIYIYTCDELEQDLFNILDLYRLNECVYYAGTKKVEVDINNFSTLPLKIAELKDKKVVSILIEKKELSLDANEEVMKYLDSDSQVSYTDSGSGFIEVRALQDKKSIIIDELRGRSSSNRYKSGKILAIGDNDNDIDLFENADISVAVANSSRNAKNIADFICENESAAGYLDMLIVIERAKRYWK